MPTPEFSLARMIAELQDRVSELEHRHERHTRYGPAEKIDPQKHLARFRIGGTDDNPFLSPWIPYSQIAGSRRHHSMPGPVNDPNKKPGDDNQGQQFLILSPDGNLENAIAVPLTWSNKHPAPSEDPDKDVDTRGKSVWWQKDGDVQQQVEKASWHLIKTNEHRRVNDSRDGSDSLQQEKKPQKQNPQDRVHYSDLDGSQGHTHSVDNDKHKITVHPDKGVEFGVNYSGTEESTPGPGTRQQNTHFGVLDKIKGLLFGANNGDHSISLDPSAGISQITKLAHQTQAGSQITDQAPVINHQGQTKLNGNTSVLGNLGISQLLSAAFGSFGFMSAGGFGGGGGGAAQIGGGSGAQVTGGLQSDSGLINGNLAVLGSAAVQGAVTLFLKTFANDAAAAAGGLGAGQLYQTSSGQVMIRSGIPIIASGIGGAAAAGMPTIPLTGIEAIGAASIGAIGMPHVH